jgi:sRNA-binding regulator protein Hfq
MQTPSILSRKLDLLQESGTVADVYMANGIRLTGIIKDFDEEAIELSSDKVKGGITIRRQNVSTVQEHNSKEEPRRK